MKELNLFLSEEYEPWFNLAVEDWIFTRMDPSVPTLYLWRNADTVVIGRYQNPWTECRTAVMERDGVYLARRQSGGGAVYHDLQNTNFTFLAGVDDYDPRVGFGMISRALKKFSVDASVSGRNDLTVLWEGEERKFSGSAFRKLSDRAFHHGTLLINTDLSRLSSYLTPPKKKLEAKGVKSVRSRVINLAELNGEINHDALCREISREFGETYRGEIRTIRIDREYMRSKEGFSGLYEKLKSTEWLYGKTPPFTHRMEGRLALGHVDLLFDVKNGAVRSVTVYTDSLYPDLIASLEGIFPGVSYRPDAVEEALKGLEETFPDKKDLLEELSEFIMGEME